MMLIDAHGPDHGLSVEVSLSYDSEVTIRQWAERDEPDENGSFSPHIHEATIPLRKLLDKSGRHYRAGRKFKSAHGKIITLALDWLRYYGGDENYVDETDRPCKHFCMNYSGIGARRTEPWPSHMKCDTCGGEPE